MAKKKPAQKIKKDDFTTVLIFPPQWTPQNPHFAITQLSGHLRSHGWKVKVKDLNVEFYDHVLTPEFLEYTRNRLAMNYDFLLTQARLKSMMGDKSLDANIEAMRLLAMDDFARENGHLLDRLPGLILDAKETLRDPRRFYNPMLLLDAFFAIDKALEMISLPFHPARISFNDFVQPHLLLATAHLIQHASDRSSNLFYNFLESKIPEILEMNGNLIGVSINSFSQVLPGLTLAMMLKKAVGDRAVVNVGGNFFGRVKDTLQKRPEFFENFCHCLSMGEGERQTLAMVEELAGGGGFARVPDVLYYTPGKAGKKGKVKYTFPQEPEKLDNIGFQDLEGLPLPLYFSPDLVLCMQSSKGCYWGKCTFCDTDFGIKKDIKKLDRLLDEMTYLREKYGVRHFEFIDESIRPSYMREMAQQIKARGLDVRWFSNGRLEEEFTGELLHKLHDGGLTMVLWGFESGSRRILDLINKGIDQDGRYEILKNSSQAGIWNFAYIFFGFPGETREEAGQTIDAIVEHNDVIDSYGRSIFTLGKHSLLCIDAKKYGIFDIVEDMEELSTNLHYKTTTGMNDDEIDEMMKECTKVCSQAYDFTLWYYLRYRENIHLYLSKYGKDYVKNYKVQKELSSRLQIW